MVNGRRLELQLWLRLLFIFNFINHFFQLLIVIKLVKLLWWRGLRSCDRAFKRWAARCAQVFRHGLLVLCRHILKFSVRCYVIDVRALLRIFLKHLINETLESLADAEAYPEIWLIAYLLDELSLVVRWKWLLKAEHFVKNDAQGPNI